jgi:hypothetical protein
MAKVRTPRAKERAAFAHGVEAYMRQARPIELRAIPDIKPAIEIRIPGIRMVCSSPAARTELVAVLWPTYLVSHPSLVVITRSQHG